MTRAWISYPDRYLGQSSMQNNAIIFYEYFISLGWTAECIAGMLGNIQVESTINPGLWQGRSIPPDIYAANKGYGLTQWTPARKMIQWADQLGLDYQEGNTQLQRILYEKENNLQWSTDNILKYTWDDFVNSTESPETLARVFVWAYERPEDPVIELRQQNARAWYNFLQSYLKLPIWLLFKIRGGIQ